MGSHGQHSREPVSNGTSVKQEAVPLGLQWSLRPLTASDALQAEAVIRVGTFKVRFWPEAVVSRIAGLERSGGAEQDRHSALSV